LSLYLVLKKGPRAGEEIKIRAGLKLGRAAADFNLQDPKASSKHAEIRLDPAIHDRPPFVLFDLESTNGIKIAGVKVKRVELNAGVSFEIGDSSFEVVNREETVIASEAKVEEWRQSLIHLTARAKKNFKKEEIHTQSFRPTLELHFMEGPQADKVFTLGYGPRKIGSASLDLTIEDPAAPETCFEIIPRDDGSALIKTVHRDLVLLNNKRVSTEVLKTGDVIKLLDSKIVVRFHDD